jgi:hypothetical protein
MKWTAFHLGLASFGTLNQGDRITTDRRLPLEATRDVV